MKIIFGIIAICGIVAVQCELIYLGSKDNSHTYRINGRTVTVHDTFHRRIQNDPAGAEEKLIIYLEKKSPHSTVNYRQDPTQAEVGESQSYNSYNKNKRPSSQSPSNVQFPSSVADSGHQRPSYGEEQLGNNYGFGNGPYDSDGLPRPETGYNLPIPRDRDNENNRGNGAITDFAWKLFKNSNTFGNSVISPLSPQILLSYLAWVADGKTRKELQDVTGYGSPRQLQQTVRSMLSAGGDKELQIATAFFTSKDMKLNKDFLEKSVNYADIVEVDFKNPAEAGRTISRWAKAKTKGGLKLNEVNYAPSTKIALTSAIYYKGKWIYSFDTAQPGQFFLENGRAISTPMISMKRKFRWGKIGNYAEWMAIPYESSEAMVIILPNEGIHVDNVIDYLGNRELEEVMRGIDSESTKATVNMTMPKFKIESTTSLIEPLKKMGVSTVFSPRADLPYLSDYDAVQVTNAEQQASMEVNEKGTVLVAFTNLNVVALSFQPPVPNVDFIVNRPFIAMVADTREKVPLMIAKITDPSA